MALEGGTKESMATFKICVDIKKKMFRRLEHFLQGWFFI